MEATFYSHFTNYKMITSVSLAQTEATEADYFNLIVIAH